MKLRGKLKQEQRKNHKILERMAGMERGSRYLFGICEKLREEKRQLEAEKEVLMMLVEGCALAAGGEITIQTRNLKRVLEEYDVTYLADEKTHTATVRLQERTEG